MDVRIKHKIASVFLAVSATLLIATTGSVGHQGDTPKRLHSPATVHGLIGGESHDSYVIHASKGQTMTVQISWQREEDNRAEFTVNRSANFNDTPVKFGKESDKGRIWSGKIPGTGDYYIYVVAHPTAQYTLKVTVK